MWNKDQKRIVKSRVHEAQNAISNTWGGQYLIPYAKKHKKVFLRLGESEHLDFENNEENGINNGAVSAFIDLSPLSSIKDLLTIIRNWINWFSRVISPVGSLKYHLDHRPKIRGVGGWTWYVDSFSHLKNQLAGHLYEEQVWKNPVFNQADFDELKESITYKDLLIYVSANYTRISDAVWVKLSDPTAVVIDEKYFAFDRKHGWSQQKVFEIIEMWFDSMNYGYIEVKNLKK